MDVKFFDENTGFVFLSWLISTLIVCHVIFGTFLMSSFMFLGPKDALSVAGRYMGGTMSCRIILMYEIAGMREVYHGDKAKERLFKPGET